MTPYEKTKACYKRNPLSRRNSQLKAKYGITLVEWTQMFEAQNQSCAICKATESTGKDWHTDHDHKTGRVRGVLCHDCNLGLGRFKDNPELLVEASKYLGV